MLFPDVRNLRFCLYSRVVPRRKHPLHPFHNKSINIREFYVLPQIVLFFNTYLRADFDFASSNIKSGSTQTKRKVFFLKEVT